MYSSENAGLVKFDLLGLKMLTVIDRTVKMINRNNINLDISKINLKDKNVFDLLSTGETTGLFQLESTGMREAIKQMKPNKFDDIIALVALYRPGPMSNIPIYNDCKNGLKEPDYIAPNLKNILKSTYGIISRTSDADSPNSGWLFCRRSRYFKTCYGQKEKMN